MGYVVLVLGVVALLVGLAEWRGGRRALGLPLALLVVDAVEIALANTNARAGALHAAEAIAV